MEAENVCKLSKMQDTVFNCCKQSRDPVFHSSHYHTYQLKNQEGKEASASCCHGLVMLLLDPQAQKLRTFHKFNWRQLYMRTSVSTLRCLQSKYLGHSIRFWSTSCLDLLLTDKCVHLGCSLCHGKVTLVINLVTCLDIYLLPASALL